MDSEHKNENSVLVKRSSHGWKKQITALTLVVALMATGLSAGQLGQLSSSEKEYLDAVDQEADGALDLYETVRPALVPSAQSLRANSILAGLQGEMDAVKASFLSGAIDSVDFDDIPIDQLTIQEGPLPSRIFYHTDLLDNISFPNPGGDPDGAECSRDGFSGSDAEAGTDGSAGGSDSEVSGATNTTAECASALGTDTLTAGGGRGNTSTNMGSLHEEDGLFIDADKEVAKEYLASALQSGVDDEKMGLLPPGWQAYDVVWHTINTTAINQSQVSSSSCIGDVCNDSGLDPNKASNEGSFLDDVMATLHEHKATGRYFNDPPTKPGRPHGPAAPGVDVSASYSTWSYDGDDDELKYEFSWGDGTSNTITGSKPAGESAWASHMWTSTGTYEVTVRAKDKWSTSEWSDPKTVVVDYPTPSKPTTPSGASTIFTGDSHSYSASSTIAGGDNIRYRFDWGDGTTTWTGYHPSGSIASASHQWWTPGQYYVRVQAESEHGKQSWWSSANGVVVYSNNGVPSTPSTPSGATTVSTGSTHPFSTSATDPDGDDVQYRFDWDDNTISPWSTLVPSGSTNSVSHWWYEAGTYLVRAQARDSNGAKSGWSAGLQVTVEGPNNAPERPSQPIGPSSVEAGGTPATYMTSTAEPDGEKVRFLFDWDDGTTTWTSFNYDDFDGVASKSWSEPGTYSVRVKAQDIQGAESSWSLDKTVTVTEPEVPPQPPGSDEPSVSIFTTEYYKYEVQGDQWWMYRNDDGEVGGHVQNLENGDVAAKHFRLFPDQHEGSNAWLLILLEPVGCPENAEFAATHTLYVNDVPRRLMDPCTVEPGWHAFGVGDSTWWSGSGDNSFRIEPNQPTTRGFSFAVDSTSPGVDSYIVEDGVEKQRELMWRLYFTGPQQEYDMLYRFLVVDIVDEDKQKHREYIYEGFVIYSMEDMDSMYFMIYDDKDGVRHQIWQNTQVLKNDKFTSSTQEPGWNHYRYEYDTVFNGNPGGRVEPQVDDYYTWHQVHWGVRTPEVGVVEDQEMVLLDTVDGAPQQNGARTPSQDPSEWYAEIELKAEWYYEVAESLDYGHKGPFGVNNNDGAFPWAGQENSANHEHTHTGMELQVIDLGQPIQDLALAGDMSLMIAEAFVDGLESGTVDEWVKKLLKVGKIAPIISFLLTTIQSGNLAHLTYGEVDVEWMNYFPVTDWGFHPTEVALFFGPTGAAVYVGLELKDLVPDMGHRLPSPSSPQRWEKTFYEQELWG